MQRNLMLVYSEINVAVFSDAYSQVYRLDRIANLMNFSSDY